MISGKCYSVIREGTTLCDTVQMTFSKETGQRVGRAKEEEREENLKSFGEKPHPCC